MSKISNITNLNDVKPFKTSWKVCVKVVHTWKQYTSYAGETLEMILADQEGTLIHGTVKKQQIFKFQRDVKYGQWTQIEHFMLSRSSGNYRATRHPYKMTIMNTSVFSRADHISDDMYIDLVSFADIAKPEYPTNILIDVIGQILDVGALKTMMVQEKPVKKIEFELRNTRDERLKCTLWAKWADIVYEASISAEEDPIICVLRFGKINEWQGVRSISSSFETSLVLINPDYPFVEAFKKELPNDGLTLAVIPEKPKAEFKEIKKSMYLDLPSMSISDLLESNDVMKCKILCEVWAIDTDYSWYIFACFKCNKSTYKIPKKENEKVSKAKKALFWCPTCQIETTKVIPRYKLWLNGRDKSGDTKFLLFDRTVKELCKIEASEILNGEMDEVQLYAHDITLPLMCFDPPINCEEKIYLSSDSLDPADRGAENNPVLTPDFLNSIKVSGLPAHTLRLKVGCPIMLLRNIDPRGGLMNGTRLQITQLCDKMVEARVITGDRVGDKVIIPRLLIIPSDTKLPFKMRRRQLPISVAFAMTINKSQGQSLDKVGLFLPRPCFSHGQLYVAISRVTNKKGLKVLIVDKEGKPQSQTINVVFKEVFKNL